MKLETWAEIQSQFPGQDKPVIRKRILRRAKTAGEVLSLLTAVADNFQRAGLRRIQATLDAKPMLKSATLIVIAAVVFAWVALADGAGYDFQPFNPALPDRATFVDNEQHGEMAAFQDACCQSGPDDPRPAINCVGFQPNGVTSGSKAIYLDVPAPVRRPGNRPAEACKANLESRAGSSAA